MTQFQKEILSCLSDIKEELKKMNQHHGYTYTTVKVNDNGEQFAASLAQLADNGFEFVEIINRNIGKYELLIKKKKVEDEE